jgi:AMMECR1 domain-containing protein
MRYDSYLELPEVPPEEWWDFPDLIRRHIEKVYPHTKSSSSAEIAVDDVEG